MGSSESDTSFYGDLLTLLKRTLDATVGPARDDRTSSPGMAKALSQREPLKLFERLGDTRWTQRRVEEISVIGRSLVQRKVWVIVKVDPHDADESDGDKKTAFLPLSRFQKKPDALERVFSVRDEDDTIVPALVPRERDRRVVQALMAATRRLLPDRSARWCVQLRRQLRAAVCAPDPKDVDNRIKDMEKLLAEASDKREEAADLLTVFQAVSRQRLLLVPVEANDELRCFSFEYISSDTFEESKEDNRLVRFAARMGWQPAMFGFPVPGAALTPLFQVLFRAPEGVAISESRIESPAGRDRGTGDPTVHQVDHGSRGARLEEARAMFRLRPHRHGLLRNGLIASTIISTMLISGAVFTGLVEHAATQADAAAALLLAAPSFFLLQAVQSFEHKVVSSMLKGLRWALLAVGLAAFFAAVLLVTFKSPPHLLWCLLATVAGLGTVSLLLAYSFGGPSLPRPDGRPTTDRMNRASKLRRKEAVLTILLLAFSVIGVLACIASLVVVAGIILEALNWVALRGPLTVPLDVAGCFLVGLVGLGTASLMVVIPLLAAARSAAAEDDETPRRPMRQDAESAGTTCPNPSGSTSLSDSDAFHKAYARIVKRLKEASPTLSTPAN